MSMQSALYAAINSAMRNANGAGTSPIDPIPAVTRYMTRLNGITSRFKAVVPHVSPSNWRYVVPVYLGISGTVQQLLASADAKSLFHVKVDGTMKIKLDGATAPIYLDFPVTATPNEINVYVISGDGSSITVETNGVVIEQAAAAYNPPVIDYIGSKISSDYLEGYFFDLVLDDKTYPLDSASNMHFPIGHVDALGSELWGDTVTLGNGWTNNGDGSFTCSGVTGSTLAVNMPATVNGGDKVLVSHEVSECVAGGVRSLTYGITGSGVSTVSSGNGVFSELVTITGTTASTPNQAVLQSLGGFKGTVSNISFKPIPQFSSNVWQYPDNPAFEVGAYSLVAGVHGGWSGNDGATYEVRATVDIDRPFWFEFGTTGSRVQFPATTGDIVFPAVFPYMQGYTTGCCRFSSNSGGAAGSISNVSIREIVRDYGPDIATPFEDITTGFNGAVIDNTNGLKITNTANNAGTYISNTPALDGTGVQIDYVIDEVNSPGTNNLSLAFRVQDSPNIVVPATVGQHSVVLPSAVTTDKNIQVVTSFAEPNDSVRFSLITIRELPAGTIMAEQTAADGSDIEQWTETDEGFIGREISKISTASMDTLEAGVGSGYAYWYMNTGDETPVDTPLQLSVEVVDAVNGPHMGLSSSSGPGTFRISSATTGDIIEGNYSSLGVQRLYIQEIEGESGGFKNITLKQRFNYTAQAQR